MKHEMKLCLWYNNRAEEAMNFYLSIFKDSKFIVKNYHGKEGYEYHHKEAGELLTAEIEVLGSRLILLNGDHTFKFNESISLVIDCETQEEIDYYWDHLSEKGDPNAQACGWLKDQFGVSWQVVPKRLREMLIDSDQRKVDAVSRVIYDMKKLDLQRLEEAYQSVK